MDLSLFHQKDMFSRFVTQKLTTVAVDYKEKYRSIKDISQTGSPFRQAGVVLLLNYKSNQDKPEYVFQLIKRSDKVSQAGDIGCPGGMLHPRFDNILSHFLKLGRIPYIPGETAQSTPGKDKETSFLIRLFLTTALREAWEEIGLNPFNVVFLGALPSYSLSLFARTIFPLACFTPHFKYKLSPEVEKVLEIPLSFFFDSANYATLNIKTSLRNDSEPMQYKCLVIPDGRGGEDILWGATFKIIDNFLRIISDDSLPAYSPSRIINKLLTTNYMPGKSDRK